MTVNTQLFLSRDLSNATINFVYPQILESLNLLVPMKSKGQIGYDSIFQPFQLKVWLYLLLSVFVFTCVWYVFKRKLLKNQARFSDMIISVCHLQISGLLTQPITTIAERFLFIGYILFAFVILSGYQTVLISILTSPESQRIPDSDRSKCKSS